MSFPQVASTATSAQGVDTTTHIVTMPSGLVSGDLLVILFAVEQAPGITPPGGVTQFFSLTETTQVRVRCYYKFADGGEGASMTFTTTSAQQSAHQTYRITGHHTSTAPEATAGAVGTTTTPDPDALTPTWGAEDTLFIALVGHRDGITTVSVYPTSYTNGFRIASAADAAGVTAASARRELNAVSDDPGAFTLSASEIWVAGTLAIRPAVVPTTGEVRRYAPARQSARVLMPRGWES